MEVDTITPEDNNEFRINSNNVEFFNRQNQIFNQLAKLEQSVDLKKNLTENEYETEKMPSTISPLSKKINKRETKCLRGKESIFKRPEAPIRRCLLPRTVPDFKINPQKWKKYSLDDVTQEDMSNRQNTASALEFIRELEDRKKTNSESIDNVKTLTNFKPTFKTSAIISNPENDDDKPLFKSSVLVMPEYVIGQRKKNSKKTKNINVDKKRKEIKLDHLLEYEEDT